jgi:hypothetical protein
MERLINALKSRISYYYNYSVTLQEENADHQRRYIQLLGEMLYEFDVDEDVVQDRLEKFLEETVIEMTFESKQFGIYSVVKEHMITKGKRKDIMVMAHFTQCGKLIRVTTKTTPISYPMIKRVTAEKFDVSITQGSKRYELIATPK